MSEIAESHLDKALQLAQELIEAEDSAPLSTAEAGELRKQHDLAIGAGGRSLDEVMENLRRVLLATPMSSSRRFFNQLYGGRDLVATAAELATVVANTQMHTFKVAGPQILVEQEVIGRMAAMAGYCGGEGIFTPGGSLANLAAMMMARNSAVDGGREDGLDGRRLVVYTSEHSHYSIRKNLGILGIGRRNQRTVQVDQNGAMDVSRLRELIVEDLDRGARPVMVNATAGTTVLGAFDPLETIAELCSEFGVWLHVDGSFGASVLFCDEHKHLLRGIERSDSLTWSPHKMMAAPLICSAILVRRSGLLTANFNEPADYLFQAGEEELNPGMQSIQCGRRNDALKVWAAWQYLGDRGMAERIRHLFSLARKAVSIIEADPDLELIRTPQSINICFRVAGASSVEICDHLATSGQAMVGHAVVDGQRVIRLVCINSALTRDDIDSFFYAVKVAARSCQLPKSVSVGG